MYWRVTLVLVATFTILFVAAGIPPGAQIGFQVRANISCMKYTNYNHPSYYDVRKIHTIF